MEQAQNILKHSKLKVTPNRLAILRTFSTECRPLSAEDIARKVTSADLVTVYRTLHSLESRGVIKKADLRREAVHYELANNHHHHITCTTCGKTEDFKACNIEKISQEILKKSPTFSLIREHSLELFGLCKACARG